MRRQMLGEFFGTGLMVAVGCGSVAFGASHGVVSFPFGAVVTLAILLFGPLSGAHINPAVTIAFWRDGQLPTAHVPAYVLAQLTGAMCGAFMVNAAAPTTLNPSFSLVEGFLIEVTITMLLMTSILLVVQRTERL